MEARKSELRQFFDRYRRSLDDASYENLSRHAVNLLEELPEIETARVVHVYWPMIDRRELDTRPFIRWLKDKGIEIVLPVVLNFQRSRHKNEGLEHVRFTGEEGLRLNRWGIAEPVNHSPVPIEKLDAVVAPAICADRNGHRLGYGFGYYDEFLEGITVPTIALVYNECLVNEVPAESHDRPVDIIVTNKEVVRPARSEAPV